MCAGALGGTATPYDAPPCAPLLCCCSSVVVGGGARRVHGALSTGRVAAAPAATPVPSGFHVCVFIRLGNSGVGRCSLGTARQLIPQAPLEPPPTMMKSYESESMWVPLWLEARAPAARVHPLGDKYCSVSWPAGQIKS